MKTAQILTLAGVVGNATNAIASEDHINFVLWNGDANGTFDAELWTGIISSQYRDAITTVAQPSTGLATIEKVVKGAHKREPETVVVVTKNEFDIDLATLTTALDKFEAERDGNDAFRGAEVLVSTPGCRVFQTVMSPTAYAPYTHIFTTPEYRRDCYAETIRVVYERDESGTAVDKTANARSVLDGVEVHRHNQPGSACGATKPDLQAEGRDPSSDDPGLPATDERRCARRKRKGTSGP